MPPLKALACVVGLLFGAGAAAEDPVGPTRVSAPVELSAWLDLVPALWTRPAADVLAGPPPVFA